ncbi:hypothetical protein WMY93_021496 [Mugilogobius chulae]|uniref:Uncharacterized protein n=1 Tax=Mugilogobius chulae TaxID=88201 RepID=A0AAW0NNA8_9GOBI
MDCNYILKLKGYGLLLLLIGFQKVTHGEELKPTIIGPDFVTVGVPSSVECVSNCESCDYSMSLDGQAAQGQGNSLAFTVNHYTEDLTVACSVSQGKLNAAVTKKLQVLVGPVNVSISGSGLLNPSATNTVSGLFVAATQKLTVNVGPNKMKIAGPDVIEAGGKAVFECSAVCLPSCRFVSSVDTQSIRGNVVELTVDSSQNQ